MSQNEDQQSDALENLEKMLLGNSNADGSDSGNEFNRLQEMLVDPELLKMRDRVLKIEQKIPDLLELQENFEEIKKNFDDLVNIQTQVEQLENSLKEVDIRPQVEQLENSLKKIENQIEQFDQSKDIIKVIIPIMSKLVNRQLREFKTEIIQELVPIIKEYQEEQRKLSIRVVGLSSDNKSS